MYRFAYYPVFKTKEELIHNLFRAFWYLGPLRKDGASLVLFYAGNDYLDININEILEKADQYCPENIDPFVKTEAQHWINNVELIPDHDGLLSNSWSDPLDAVIQWTSEMPSEQKRGEDFAKRSSAMFAWVDADKNMQDSLSFALIHDQLLEKSGYPGHIHIAHQRFRKMAEVLGKKESYIFGTAPTLSQAIDSGIRFDDTTNIVCNSAVKNEELMDLLKPRVIVAADPIFHGGFSRYAGEFREDVIKALKKYDAYLLTQYNFIKMFEHRFGEDLHDRIIGIPSYNNTISLNLCDSFSLGLRSQNIMTMIMLPAACSLSDKVNIIGCDGRSFLQNSYFWNHDKKSQYNDRMDEIQKIHPAFFQRDFDEYYLSHCELLEEILVQAEGENIEINNVTPSYIPALAKRYKALV